MSGKKIKIIIIATALSSVSLFYTNLRAEGFGVYPSIVEINVDIKEVRKGSLLVVNKYDYEVEVKTELVNWLKKKGYNNNLSEIDPYDYFKLEPSSFRINANSKKTINYEITLPNDIKGELVTMIFFSPTGKNESIIKTRFGVSIYTAVKNTEKLDCKIIYTNTNDSNDKKRLLVKLENNGNVHVRPNGSFVVTDKGKVVKIINMNAGIPVYPGRSHIFVKDIEKDALKTGSYKVHAIFEYGKIYGELKTIHGEKVDLIF